jgi:hypothetical protein
LPIDLFQHIGIDMLDLVREDIAMLRQFADRVRRSERAIDVRVKGIDLFRGRTGGIEDNGLDVETVGGLHHHTTKLSERSESATSDNQGPAASSVPDHLPGFLFCESPSRQR